MDFWDARYAEPELAYGEAPNDWLRACADHLPAGPALCLAEGQGRNAVWLAGRGHAVTAVDQSAVGLRRAAELAASRGVVITTEQADLATWDGPEGRYAVVVLIFAHLPPPIRERVHRSVARWLAPGGVVVLEAYRPEQLPLATGGPRDAALTYTVDLLRRDFDGLVIDHLEAVEREVLEGPYHHGRAAVVQLRAHRPG